MVEFQTLKTEYLSGLTLKELGIKYSLDKSTIRWKLNRYGFKDFRPCSIKGKYQPKGLTMTESSKLKISQSQKGKNNSNWKGGTSKLKGVCEYCGKQLTVQKAGRDKVRFCSNKCSSKVLKGKNNGMYGKRGDKNPQWKEKKANELNNAIRHSQDYKEWRTATFIRDNYTCRRCGKHGGYLEVHHIYPFRKIIKQFKIKTYNNARMCEQLWDIDNGITYCIQCHSEVDEMRNITKVKNDGRMM